ncbi:MAG: NifB/NifX family molybdenum-iron cluster-binding protein [Eubacteriales bacterium]|nr:NifB/NifX family molybdenum-iron cluster-binding protein [Eubacteriales bacterium]
MARPKKCRRVCSLPENAAFVPASGGQKEPIILAVDEYETIRLIDREGLSQEQCGTYMGVARTSVQLIYASARRKLAESLVDGRPLKIEGGDYKLCDGRVTGCGVGGCWKRRDHSEHLQQNSAGGNDTMKIAVTYEDGRVFQHFGHTAQFKIYEIQQNQVVSSQILDTNGSGHGALAGFLRDLGVMALICGGIGGGARMALAEAGIEIYGGVSGEADEAVQALLAGKLEFNPNAACNHHHEGEHTCGDHGCGSHSCH